MPTAQTDQTAWALIASVFYFAILVARIYENLPPYMLGVH